MLNKEALQHIESQAILANGIPETDVPVAVLPDTASIKSLEQFQNRRSRFRGALKTTSLADFCEYVKIQAASGSTAGFVDKEGMRCEVIFNLGTKDEPGHGDHRATLSLKPTAAYSALIEAAKQSRFTQKELAEFMEDWHEFISAKDGVEEMATAAAIAAVRNITIKAASESTHTEHSFGAARSAMDVIEASSQDKLPTELHFKANPYDDLDEQTFVLRVSAMAGENKPVLSVRWVSEGQQREDIAREFKEVLSSKIGSDTSLTIGTFALSN